MKLRQNLNTVREWLAGCSSVAMHLPWQLLLAGMSILFFLLWSSERGARLRQAYELRQVKQQSQEETRGLEAQAAAAAREANQRNAEVIRNLNFQRHRLEREGEGLRQRLAILRQGERARVEEVASLPTSEVVNRLAARLGPEAVAAAAQAPGTGNREEGTDARGSGVTRRESGTEKSVSDSQPPVANLEFQISGYRSSQPLAPSSQPLPSNPALALTEHGARKVEATLVELDACREQKDLTGQQLENCQEQVKTSAAILERQSASLNQLNHALALKEEILVRREAEHQAELKAAKGTWRTRLARALKFIAAGVVIGVAIR